MRGFSRKGRALAAFSLLEILLSISIIVVLMSMVVGAFSVAERSTKLQRTKVLFVSLEGALGRYYRHYGSFPDIASLRLGLPMNLGNSDNSLRFMMALSARDPRSGLLLRQMGNNAAFSSLNPHSFPFYRFQAENVVYKRVDVDTPVARFFLVDAFRNKRVHLMVDHDQDGFITIPDSLPGVPMQSGDVARTIPAFALFWSSADKDSESIYVWR